MARSAAKKASNIVVWVVLGLLFIALAGFGVTSFTGSGSRVAQVGDTEITVNEYARELERELRAASAETGQNLRLSDLRARGQDRLVLERLVARAGLADEASDMGLSVSDETVAEQIAAIEAFQTNGSFNRENYEFQLNQLGLSVAEFEERLRRDTTIALLQTAVLAGASLPESFAEAIVAREGEARSFTIASVTEADIDGGLPEPTAEELQAHYEENEARFTRPERRRVTYAWISPDMLRDEVEVDEDALRALYDDRADEYIRPERRIVERLVFPNEEAAAAARGRIDAGESDFDAEVEARGLRLEDIDLGDVTSEELSDAAADAVFALDGTGVVGPVESTFGPALFRVNAVLDASEISFEDARDDLRTELAAATAIRTIADAREEIEDLLAGGATLEELAGETMLELGQIDYGPDIETGIAGYDDFRQAVSQVQEGDFPEILDLSDGGIFALRLDETIEPELPPLEEIEAEVVDDWARSALRDAMRAEAEDRLARIVTTGARLEDLEFAEPLRSETGIRRQDFVDSVPPTLVAQVFQLEGEGDLVVIPAADAAHIVRLDAIEPALRAAPETQALLQIVNRQAAQSVAQDLFESFGRAMEADLGITIDQSMIDAVHAQFP